MNAIQVLRDKIYWNKMGIDDAQDRLKNIDLVEFQREYIAQIEEYNDCNIDIEKAILILEGIEE